LWLILIAFAGIPKDGIIGYAMAERERKSL